MIFLDILESHIIGKPSNTAYPNSFIVFMPYVVPFFRHILESMYPIASYGEVMSNSWLSANDVCGFVTPIFKDTNIFQT